jgi:hypothetical protein
MVPTERKNRHASRYNHAPQKSPYYCAVWVQRIKELKTTCQSPLVTSLNFKNKLSLLNGYVLKQAHFMMK